MGSSVLARLLPALAILAGLDASPLRAQIYPGVQGEPDHMDVSCLCQEGVPPSGDYLMANDIAYSRGVTIPTGKGYETRIDVGECGESLQLRTGGRSATLTRQMLGSTEVYRGPYTTDDGVEGTMTLVVADYDGLPFEPAVRMLLRGEAQARGVRFPLVVQLQNPDAGSFEACECAMMARYYERIAQYRESFADASLIEEARQEDLSVREYQQLVGERRTARREAFDRSLGRTEDDDLPGGGGSTTQSGTIHVDDLDMLDRGVPPAMIESVHVHEEVHQQRRFDGVEMDDIEALAADEVAASEVQLDFLESWLGANCSRWQPPTRVF